MKKMMIPDRRSFLRKIALSGLVVPVSYARLKGSRDRTDGAEAVVRNKTHTSGSQWCLDIGLRKQLLVDDFMIAERRFVTRVLGNVTKANEGNPIFNDGWFAGTVLHDGGLFKMWYIPRKQDFSDEARLKAAYAESKDGLEWTKKSDLVGPVVGAHLAILIDRHEKDPKHRYKAAYHPTLPPYAACLAHSADGVTWTSYNDGRPVTGRASDTWNQLLWDDDAQVYRLFTRTDFGDPGGPGEIRGTRSMINPDVKTDPTRWTTIRSWRFDREGYGEYHRRQIYALTDWIHEDVHFALMAIYEWVGDLTEGPHDLDKRHERGIMNFYIATSRDADNWDLSWVYAGRPFIPRGPDGGFDKDCVYPPSQLLTYQDKHWVYYGGGRERHDIAAVSWK